MKVLWLYQVLGIMMLLDSRAGSRPVWQPLGHVCILPPLRAALVKCQVSVSSSIVVWDCTRLDREEPKRGVFSDAAIVRYLGSGR